jgi:hypothetical protein
MPETTSGLGRGRDKFALGNEDDRGEETWRDLLGSFCISSAERVYRGGSESLSAS